jgi:hypothetical protein
MIARYDITQGSLEWFLLKWGKIGGSTSKGLFVPSDTLLYQLLAEHTEEYEEEDGYVSADMQRGIELEHLGRSELSKYAGVSFSECGWLQSEENELLGISPDGISSDETITCELKCPSAKKHISTVYCNDIPSDNIHQCLHYFTVNPKLQAHIFGSFRPESKYPLWAKWLRRDSIIDLGTKAKPQCKTVQQWADIALHSAEEIKSNLELSLKQLDKI